MVEVYCTFDKCLFYKPHDKDYGVCTKDHITLDEEVSGRICGCPDAEWDEPQIERLCNNCKYYGGGEVCDHPSIGEVEMGGKGDTFPWIKETPKWCPLKTEPQTDCAWGKCK